MCNINFFSFIIEYGNLYHSIKTKTFGVYFFVHNNKKINIVKYETDRLS